MGVYHKKIPRSLGQLPIPYFTAEVVPKEGGLIPQTFWYVLTEEKSQDQNTELCAELEKTKCKPEGL